MVHIFIFKELPEEKVCYNKLSFRTSLFGRKRNAKKSLLLAAGQKKIVFPKRTVFALLDIH